MIENLTKLSFAQFGIITAEGLDRAMSNCGFSFIKQRDIYEKQVKGLFINKKNYTVIDVLEGTAILYVGKTPDNLQMFLLDKTVCIHKNMYFYVTPLLTRTTIASSTDGNWPEYIEIPPTKRPVGINPGININKIYTLFYHEKELGFKFKGETHELWEITYVDKGYMYNVIGEEEQKRFMLAQGDLMIFTPGQRHLQYADDNVSVCYVTVSFEMDFPNDELFEDYIFKCDSEIKKLLEKIISEKETQSIYSDDMILCYLKELIVRLIRHRKLENILTKTDTLTKNYIENDITEYVKDYIKRNIHKKLSVGEIAKSIPVNASYLSTLFKHNTNITLIEYIGKQKLDKAKDYIRTGKYTFTQISEMLSFNSVHYFSKLFKKQFDITPSEYAGSIKK